MHIMEEMVGFSENEKREYLVKVDVMLWEA